MNLDFTKSHNLRRLETELLGIERLPPFDEVKNEVKDKDYEIIFTKAGKEVAGGCLWYKREVNRAHIYLLFIKSRFRGREYSNKTLEYTIENLNQKGFSQVSACVGPSNQRSLVAFLKNNFRIASFLCEKNMLMLLKDLKITTPKYSEVYSLLFEEDQNAKRQLLERILRDPISALETLRGIDLEGLDKNKMTSQTRLMYLRYLVDSNNLSGPGALKELGEEIDNVSKVMSGISKLKLLKFIAIHSEKEKSQKAIRMLYESLDEILSIQNPELQASLLRYLAVHTSGDIQKEVVEYMERIRSKKIKDTSLDYFKSYVKNGRKR